MSSGVVWWNSELVFAQTHVFQLVAPEPFLPSSKNKPIRQLWFSEFEFGIFFGKQLGPYEQQWVHHPRRPNHKEQPTKYSLRCESRYTKIWKCKTRTESTTHVIPNCFVPSHLLICWLTTSYDQGTNVNPFIVVLLNLSVPFASGKSMQWNSLLWRNRCCCVITK